jgi:hypothetical protein
MVEWIGGQRGQSHGVDGKMGQPLL